MFDDKTKKFLLTIEPFQYLNEHELDTILAHSRIIHFEPQETILQQGKKSEGMYIILDGKAAVKARILGEGIVDLATIGQGNFIGEISMIDKTICTATVIAINRVRCLLILSDYFEMLSKFFPDLRHKIMKGITEVVYKRLIFTQNKIEALMQEIKASPSLTSLKYIQNTDKTTKITLDKIGLDQKRLRESTFFNCFTDNEYAAIFKNSQFIHAPKRCLISNSTMKNQHYIIFRGAIQAAQIYQTKAAKLAVIAPYAQFGNYFSQHDLDNIAYFSCDEVILMQFSPENLHSLQNMNIHLWYKLYDYICHSIISLEKYAYKFFIRFSSEFHDTPYKDNEHV